jgi:predicted house-cleaning NTP pyrophosphatase (Maf/HAM1 superfamily)
MLLEKDAAQFLAEQHADHLLVAADGTVACSGRSFQSGGNR